MQGNALKLLPAKAEESVIWHITVRHIKGLKPGMSTSL